MTWGTIIFEFLLFAGIVMDKQYKKRFLILGLLFHFSIFLIHDLASFFCTMCGCLILYFIPLASQITFSYFIKLKNYSYEPIYYCRTFIANLRRSA